MVAHAKQLLLKAFRNFASSPLLVAGCAAIPVVYISLPAFRLCLLVLTAVLLAGSLLLIIRSFNPLYIRLCLAAAIGLAAGFVFMYRTEQFSPGLPLETIGTIKGTLLDDPRTAGWSQNSGGERGMALLELAETGTGSGTAVASARGRALVYFPAGTMPRLRSFGRGAEIFLEGSFLPGEDNGKSMPGAMRFRAASVHIVKAASALEQQRTSLRSAILDRLKPKAWGGLAAALLIGTRENLESGFELSFRNAGLAYLLALSGMHLAFLSAMLAFLLKRPLGKKGSLIAGFVFIVCYVFLVGPQPSLVRSAIMYGLGCFMVLSGTMKQSLALLSVTFLVQILRDPPSAYSVSFIFSYLAMAGILLLSGPVLTLLRTFLPPVLSESLSVSGGAFLATAPAVSAFFGILRPVGILAGLLAVPLTAFFMALSLLWLFLGNLPVIGLILDKALAALQFIMFTGNSFFARFPGITPGFPLVCFLTVFSALLLFLLADRQVRYRNEFIRFTS